MVAVPTTTIQSYASSDGEYEGHLNLTRIRTDIGPAPPSSTEIQAIGNANGMRGGSNYHEIITQSPGMTVDASGNDGLHVLDLNNHMYGPQLGNHMKSDDLRQYGVNY